MQERATQSTGRSGLDLEFPPLSRTVQEVNRLVRVGQEGTDDLAVAISHDPMMAATVLRRVNSAFYGVRRQVSDLARAVYLLGFGDVSNLVLTASFLRLTDMVDSHQARVLFSDLMQLSLGAGMYSRLIAQELELEDEGMAYSAGMMHTSGRVVLLFNFPDAYTRLCRPGTSDPLPSASLERSEIGIDHAQAAGLALTEWQMPDDLVQLVSCLEAPGRLKDSRLRELALCVSIGISATEQLCLRSAPGLAFEAKAALHVLARLRGKQASQIAACITEHRQEINDEIASVATDISAS